MSETKNVRKRILIAEDDPVSRRLLELFLVKWGFEVSIATTGTEALQMLERLDAPRLAILDWMMPGMEGVQVCQKLRETADRKYVYVLLLTARTQKEDLLQGLESGADDYLTKPFDAQELRARLHVGQRILDLQDQLIAAGEELLYRATHDNLTGVVNRGVILDTLRRERIAAGARRWVVRSCADGSGPLQIRERHVRASGRRRRVARGGPAHDGLRAAVRFGGALWR